MCDWECAADGCQDNMGASHPSRLVDEQEKSAGPRWCMGRTGGAGRAEPLLSAPPPSPPSLPCSLSHSHAHLPNRGWVGGGCCSFSETVVVTFSLCRPFPHMFYFFIRLLKITRASSHIFVLICTSSVLLSSGRVKEISSVFIHALHVFVFLFFFTGALYSECVICHWKHIFQANRIL